jgi:flagellar assembly protein FliH
MVQRSKKFLFERSFDDPNRLYLPGERRRAEAEAEAAGDAAEQAARDMAKVTAAPPPVPEGPSAEELLQAQLEAAREEGYVQGHTAALEEAETAREHYIADAMSLIGKGIDSLGDQQRAAYDQMANEALRMVYAIVHKLLPPVAQSHAAETIGEFVKEVLPLAASEPRLIVRAHNMITADLEARLKPITTRAGFRGEVVVVPDYELQPGDCRIEWDGGGADRDEARIWRDIRTSIAATLGDLDPVGLDAAADSVAETPQPEAPPAAEEPVQVAVEEPEAAPV